MIVNLSIATSGLDMLQNGIDRWNDYYQKILTVLTTSPDVAYPTVWTSMSTISNYLKVIGISLSVIFFYVGLTKSTLHFEELRRPEKFIGVFIRLAIGMGLVNYGFDLSLIILQIFQGCIVGITEIVGFGSNGAMTSIPTEIYDLANNLETGWSLGLYVLCLLGFIAMFGISLVLFLTVYVRFIKIYIYAAISPLALASLSSDETGRPARTFIVSYMTVCLQGVIIAIAFIIFSNFVSTGFVIDANASVMANLCNYLGFVLIHSLILVTTVRISDQLTKDMIGSGY